VILAVYRNSFDDIHCSLDSSANPTSLYDQLIIHCTVVSKKLINFRPEYSAEFCLVVQCSSLIVMVVECSCCLFSKQHACMLINLCLSGQLSRLVSTNGFNCHCLICFYRAMLCISAIHAVTRCPSVRPSRSWITSKRIHISSKFFSPSGSQAILVFPYQRGWRYSDGNPPNGGVECKGV